MNTQFERAGSKTTKEWYTPPEIIRSLGEFDLDPCTSEIAYKLNHSAKNYYTKKDDGLSKKWFGRIWLNPPYDQPLISHFVKKMAQHGNGIALLYNRCDNKLFCDVVFPTMDSIFFIHGRIRFYRPNGVIGGSPGCGSILVAWGKENTKSIENSRLKGTILKPIYRQAIQSQITF